MKKYAIIVGLILITFNTNAQLLKKLKEKVVSKTEQKADAKIDRKIDVTIDSVMEGNVRLPKKEPSVQNDSLSNTKVKKIKKSRKKKQESKEELQTSSLPKFDFNAGERIVFFENFSDDATDDFHLPQHLILPHRN